MAELKTGLVLVIERKDAADVGVVETAYRGCFCCFVSWSLRCFSGIGWILRRIFGGGAV